MSKFNRVVLGVALALAMSPVLAEEGAAAPAAAKAPAYTAKSPKLSRAQIDALLAHPENLVVVDVRRPDELTSIGGFAAYLSIQSKDLANELAYIPKDRTVVTVSNHAARGGAAADLLASKGFKVAGAIGVEDYEAEGGTLIKIAKPEPKPATGGNVTAAAVH